MAEISPGPLRIVLFGPSGTGKTALLTAMAASARIEPGRVQLLDCDGKLAESLLQGDLEVPTADQAALADSIVHADVLVLTIDAAAPPKRLDEIFTLASRFLKTLEEARGGHAEVSGLPVYLVLTHCDLLVRSQDNLVAWLERVEERKRSVESRFHDFLAGGDDRQAAFGDIELRLWATAIGRPALAGTAASSTPFGVAELFRQCCEEGLAYRAARQRSSRRLGFAVAGVGGVVLLLLGLSLGLLLQKQPGPRSLLERRIETLRFSDRTGAGQRLGESVAALETRLTQLSEAHADPGFAQLPEDYRSFVLEREEELNEYLKIRDRVLALQPADANSLEDLNITRSSLEVITLPADWNQTTAAQDRARQLEDAERLRQAAERAEAWFDRSSAEAAAILRGDPYRGRAIAWSEWYQSAKALSAPSTGPGSRPAPRADDPIEGTHGLRMALVLGYPEVALKALAWAEKKKQLEQAAGLVVELGLTRVPGHKQALLSFEEDFRLESAERRLQELQTSAPQLLEPGLSLTGMELGQALRGEFDARAREQYQFLLGLERQILLARFRKFDPNNEESPERWAYVAEALPSADDAPPTWLKLAAILARVQDPPASINPVADLRAFLKKDSFPLWARTLQLEIPASVGNRPLPGAQLRITIGRRKSAATEVMVFDLIDTGGPPQTPTFLFQRKDRSSVLYLRGDNLKAELVVDNGQQFTWNLSRTMSYQFEVIYREPWKHRERGTAEEGTRLKFVRLRVLDVSAPGEPPPWPQVPDLLPDVRKGN